MRPHRHVHGAWRARQRNRFLDTTSARKRIARHWPSSISKSCAWQDCNTISDMWPANRCRLYSMLTSLVVSSSDNAINSIIQPQYQQRPSHQRATDLIELHCLKTEDSRYRWSRYTSLRLSLQQFSHSEYRRLYVCSNSVRYITAFFCETRNLMIVLLNLVCIVWKEIHVMCNLSLKRIFSYKWSCTNYL